VLKRALIGILKGALVGGLLAAAVIYGLGFTVFPIWLAYLGAVATGALTGLVAGKAIWERDSRIEVSLKAAVGALIAAGAMFAIRKWLNVSLDLGPLGHGNVGQLPVTSLPMIATALALFYEIDNTGEPAQAKAGPKSRVEAPKSRAPELESDLDAELEDEASAGAERKLKH